LAKGASVDHTPLALKTPKYVITVSPSFLI